jgi:hypothetical protein
MQEKSLQVDDKANFVVHHKISLKAAWGTLFKSWRNKIDPIRGEISNRDQSFYR